MIKKYFYPDGMIVPFLFLPNLIVLVILFKLFMHQPLILAMAVFLFFSSPISIFLIFRICIDTEKQTVSRLNISIPFSQVTFSETSGAQGKGWAIKDKQSGQEILLPNFFFRPSTAEEIKQIIQRRAIV